MTYTGKIETLQELIDVLTELRDIQHFDKNTKVIITGNFSSPIQKISYNRGVLPAIHLCFKCKTYAE